MTPGDDWPALIGRHLLVQQQITQLDSDGLWLGSQGLVDTFPSFTAFFASMTQYQLEEVGSLSRN